MSFGGKSGSGDEAAMSANDTERSTDIPSFVTLIALLVLVNGFAFCVCMCHKRREQYDQSHTSPGGTAQASPTGAMSWTERKKYIEATLQTRRYMPDKTNSDTPENKGANNDSVALSKADIETATDSSDEEEFSDSEHQCAICLTDYKEGDKICGSPNRLCQHQFHRTCITKWLMKKEECPYCRQKFLESDGEAEEDNDACHSETSETTTTATS